MTTLLEKSLPHRTTIVARPNMQRLVETVVTVLIWVPKDRRLNGLRVRIKPFGRLHKISNDIVGPVVPGTESVSPLVTVRINWPAPLYWPAVRAVPFKVRKPAVMEISRSAETWPWSGERCEDGRQIDRSGLNDQGAAIGGVQETGIFKNHRLHQRRARQQNAAVVMLARPRPCQNRADIVLRQQSAVGFNQEIFELRNMPACKAPAFSARVTTLLKVRLTVSNNAVRTIFMLSWTTTELVARSASAARWA